MKRIAILLVFLLLLTGCAVAPAQESTAPSTTLPAQTEPSTAPDTEPATPPKGDLPTTLPWEIPESEVLSYEDYFAQVRAFDGPYGVETDFMAEQKGNKLYITQRSTGTGFLIGNLNDYGYLVDGKDPLDWICDAGKMYGLLEGKLVSFDYLSRKLTVLYEQDGEVILSSDLRYQRECLFFVAGEPTKGFTIYRLYLPDGTLDALKTKIPVYCLVQEVTDNPYYINNFSFELYTGSDKQKSYDIRLLCADNETIQWREYNHEYWDLYAEHASNLKESSILKEFYEDVPEERWPGPEDIRQRLTVSLSNQGLKPYTVYTLRGSTLTSEEWNGFG